MANTYLTRTPSSNGNLKKWTLSMWAKRSGLGQLALSFAWVSGNEHTYMQFNGSDQLVFGYYNSGGGSWGHTTTRVFRDTSAWYHFQFELDTSLSSGGDRAKIYVNGIRETAFASSTDPGQNTDTAYGKAVAHYIGSTGDSQKYWDGSMANVEFVDGQAYGPAYFGSTNTATGIWTPSGATAISDYGTNGFKLKMDTTSPGADTSGKGNTFTASGTPTLTQGSPSNNYACMNPLKTQNGYSLTMNNGNLRVRQGQAGQTNSIPCTMPVKKGKWYVEVQPVSSLSNSAVAFGIGQAGYGGSFLNGEVGGFPGSLGGVHYNNSGNIQWYASGDQSTSTGTTFTGGSTDKIAIALDCDNTKIYWYKNNVLVNSGGFDYSVCTGSFDSPFTTDKQSIVGEYVVFMMAGNHSSGDDVVVNWNFGDGFFATAAAGTNADGNGQGLFAYPPPTGYYALNTKNLEAYG